MYVISPLEAEVMTTVDVPASNVRRELVSEFMDTLPPSQTKAFPLTLSEVCLSGLNGVEDVDNAVPPRPPPPVPPRSPSTPLRVSVTEVGGFPDDKGLDKISVLEQEVLVLREETKQQAKTMQHLQRKLGKYESVSKARKVRNGIVCVQEYLCIPSHRYQYR